MLPNLPTILSPTTLCRPDASSGFSDHRAYRRYPPSVESRPTGSCVTWASPLLGRLATAAGRIEFLIVRTGRLLPVALHLALRRRSYLQLRGSRQTSARTCTL